MWVKRQLSEEYLEGLDPDEAWYWVWEGEGPPPEGSRPSEMPAQPNENLTDSIIDRMFPTPSVRVPTTKDPVAEFLDNVERTAQEPLNITPDVTHTTEGKIPEQRMELPSFTQQFPTTTLRPLRKNLLESGAAEEVAPYSDPLEPVMDFLGAPVARTYQAATGRMSEAQQRGFALNTGLGAAGGGLVGAALGTLLGAGTATASDSPPTGPQALIPFERSTIETLGGPLTVTNKELMMLGGAAAFTVGMMFGPQAVQKIVTGTVPRLQSLLRIPPGPRLRPAGENAAPGTMAVSNRWDYIRGMDDVNAPLRRIMRRMGVDPVVAREVDEVFRIQTRTTTNALTDAAVSEGRMITPSYQFQVRTPLATLKQVESQDFANYLHTLDTIDEIKIQSMLRRNDPNRNPQAGNIRVLGLTLADADQIKRALEQANPEFRALAKEYNNNLRAMRAFESEGEYAIRARKRLSQTNLQIDNSSAFLNAHRPYEVPWRGQRVTGEPVERGSPINALAEHMRERLRARMENEAVGMYVDAMRNVDRRIFRRITQKELDKNPNWKNNVVEFYRRGKKELYTADRYLADALRMDPYYMTGTWSGPLYSTKRLVEMTTTGELAPWFAPVSMWRNFRIGRQVADPEPLMGPINTVRNRLAGRPDVQPGRKPPSFTGTFITAIPEQLIMESARVAGPWMGRRLDEASNGWLGQMFGQQGVQALGHRLSTAYHRSFYGQLQAAGGGRGSIMQQQVQENSRLSVANRLRTANQRVDNALRHLGNAGKTLLNIYRNVLNATHNAPAYSYAKRNRDRGSITQIAREARHMTGDPRIGGQYYVGSRTGSRPIKYESGSDSRVSHTLDKFQSGYGWLTEAGRSSAPWYNATVQGVKRIGEAYLNDPVRFTTRLWLYEIMPAASIYYYHRSLGRDPNGVSYVEHQMQRRSEYDRLMNQILYIPGRPVEEGIRFPRYHESSIAGLMTEIMMDHAVRSNIHDLSQDFMRASLSFAELMVPAMPPAVNVVLASQGMMTTSNPFTGEAYRRRQDPYDQNGGLPGNLELYVRAIAPGIGDIVGEGYAAATQTPEGFIRKAQNGATAMVRRTTQKTPFLRDVAGVHPPASGNNQITEELFRKQRVLRDLQVHYRKWVKNQGLIGARLTRDGDFVPSVRSHTGEMMAQSHLGDRAPMEPAGISQPEVKNPLYTMFIQMIHDRLLKDAPWTGNPTTPGGLRNWESGRTGIPTGAIGQLSIWKRYGDATENISRLRKINEGNMATWQRELMQRPEQLKYLKENNVDPTKLSEIRNFYEHQRQNAARTLLFNIKMVEAEMSELAGRPIKLEDLHPYKKPFENDENVPYELPEIGEDQLLPNAP